MNNTRSKRLRMGVRSESRRVERSLIAHSQTAWRPMSVVRPRQIDAGRVMINAAPHEPLAPHSGIGREFGAFGIEALLEPRAIIA